MTDVTNLKTITFDPAVYKLVPVDPTTQMVDGSFDGISFSWDAMLAAVPDQLQGVVVHEGEPWNQVQICTWIGNQLMSNPSMFNRHEVCKFVRSLGRNAQLAKHLNSPVPSQLKEDCDSCKNWKATRNKCGNATCHYEAIVQAALEAAAKVTHRASDFVLDKLINSLLKK